MGAKKNVFKKGVNVVTLISFLVWNLASATPQGGNVVAGSAAITQSGTTTTINQSSQNAVINWTGFNTAGGETVKFNQPNASAIALNKIYSGQATTFNGNLLANGQVWIVNPNGIVFGSNSNVNVAGLVATTMDIKNSNFMAGNYQFYLADPNSTASVINNGTITIADNGIAALVAPNVVNNGTIIANLGKVSLSTGSEFVLDMYGDSLINFGTSAPSANGSVSNTGLIKATGGKVYMTANTVAGILDNVISMSGVIEANTAKTGQQGAIILNGGEAGAVSVAGTLKAKNTRHKSNGGHIETSGYVLDLDPNAVIDAGVGGSWLIDPANVTITTVATSGEGIVGGAYTPTSGTPTSTILNTEIENLLAVGTSVTINTINTGASGLSAGNITISAPITYTQTSGTTPTLTFNAVGNITFTSATDSIINNASSTNPLNVIFNSGTGTTISAPITTLNGGSVAVTDTAGTIAINAAVNTGATGAVTLTENSGNINQSAAGVITADTLTTSSTTGTALNSATSAVSNFNATNTGGAIAFTDSGALTITGISQTGSNVTITDTTGNITFPSTLNGAFNLTASAASGTVTFDGVVGGTTPLSSLTVTGTADINTTAITTANNQVFNNAVSLGSNLILTSNSGSITFKNTVAGNAFALSLTTPALAADAIQLDGNITNVSALTIGTNTVATQADINTPAITTTGSQTYYGLVTLYNTGDVMLTTTAGGNITLTGATWTSTHALDLTSNADIVLNGPMSGTNGSLNLSATNAAQSITTGVNGTINVANFDLLQGQWYQDTATLPAFNVSKNFQINSGVLPNATTQFIRATSGDGSSGTPYVLMDIYGVQGIDSNSTLLTDYFNLGGGVNAATTSTWNGGAGFIPIGNATTNYTGSFNGNGFVINGLSINSASTSYVGLFGYVTGNTTIQNLGLTGINYNLSGTESYVGGLVGFEANTNLSRDYVTGTINASGSMTDLGGLVGSMNSNSSTITDSYATATITAGSGSTNVGGLVGYVGLNSIFTSYSGGYITINGTGTNVGGLVGQATPGATTSNVLYTDYSFTSITINGNGSDVGGFAGLITAGTINDNYASGPISVTGTNTNVGGFVGALGSTNALLTNNFWDIGTSGQTKGYGGLTGGATSGQVTALLGGCYGNTSCGTPTNATNTTPVDLSLLATYTGSGWSITATPSTTSTAPAFTWFIIPGSTRPILMMENTSNIVNTHELQMMSATLGGSYTLGNNLDFSGTIAADVWDSNFTTFTGGGFVPVGPAATPFSGSLNGEGLSINALYINPLPNTVTGLFGTTSSSANISNVGVTNATIDVNNTATDGSASAGILIGSNSGSISNSYVTGNITAGVNNYDTGGLAGYNFATGDITNSISYATVTSGTGSNNVGDFVGENTGAISTSYSIGSVMSGTGSTSIGGFAGMASGTVSDIYSFATITANSSTDVGGLYGSFNGGTLQYSYAVGVMLGSGNTNEGGLVGLINGGALKNSVWDVGATGVSAGYGATSSGSFSNVYGGCFGNTTCGTPSNATNTTTYDLTLLSNYTGIFGWPGTVITASSNTPWNIVSAVSYPYLHVFYPTTPRFVTATSAAAGGTQANLYVSAALHDTTVAGANGQVYFLEGNNTVSHINTSISDNALLLMDFPGASPASDAIVYAPVSGGQMGANNGLALTTNTLTVGLENTANTQTYTNSTLATAIGSLTGSSILFSVSGNNLNMDTGDNFVTTTPTTYTVNGNITATSANIAMNGPVVLSANSTIMAATSGSVTFGSTINGAFGLTASAVAGMVAFDGVVGGTTALSSLTVTGTTDINTTAIKTSGAQLFNSAVVMGANSTLTSNSGSITFDSTVDSCTSCGGPFGLTAIDNAGTGSIIFGGAIGTVSALNSLTATITGATSGTIQLNGGTINTVNNQTYNGPVSLGATDSLTSSSGNITFGGTVNGAFGLTASAAAAGAVAFDGVVGGTTPVGSLDVTMGTTDINTTAITTSGNQAYSDAAALGANATLTSNSSSITFGSTLNGNNHGLTLITPPVVADENTLNGSFSNLNNLTIGSSSVASIANITTPTIATTTYQTYWGAVTMTQTPTTFTGSTITFNAHITDTSTAIDIGPTNLSAITNLIVGTSGSITAQSLFVSGTTTAPSVTTTNGQIYTGAVTLNSSPTTYTDSSANGILFDSTIDGDFNLAVSAASGAVTFGGAVGGTTAVGSLNVTGTADINGGTINTVNNQLFNNAVSLGADATLTSTSGSITFGSTLNGNNHGLTLITPPVVADEITLNGSFSDLNNLTIGSSSVASIANITTPTIATATYQTYWGAVTMLPSPTTFTGSTITFNAPITDTSTAIDIGPTDLSAITNLVVGPAASITAQSLFVSGTTSAPSVTTSNGQTYTGAVTLNTNATYTDTSAQGIIFDSTINGNFNLVLSASSGAVTFGGVVGGTAALNSLNVTGTADINTTAITTVNDQVFNNAVLLGSNSTLTSNSGNITFDSTLNGAHALAAIVPNGKVITFGGAVGGTTALTSVTTSATGTTDINTTAINTAGAQLYNNAVSLLASGTTTLNSAEGAGNTGGSITFGGAVTGNSNNLTLISPVANPVQLDGNITGLNSLTIGSMSIPLATVADINTALISATAYQDYYGPVVLNSPTVTLTTGAAGSILFNSTVNATTLGAQSLVANASPTGTVTFDGIVGATPLSSLTVTGAADINTTAINTAGAQLYNNAVSLLASGTTTLNSAEGAGNTGGSITFGGAVTGNNNNLTLISPVADPIQLDGNITGLNSLTIGSMSIPLATVADINTASISVTAYQDYYGPVVLNSPTVTLTTGAAGSILFKSTINATTTGAQSLVANASPTGTVTFEGIVGATALNNLTVTGTADIDTTAITTLNNQLFNNAVVLGANPTFTSTAGNITFDGTVNGAHALDASVPNGQVITFGGAVGGTTALTSVTTSATGTTDINGGAVTTTGLQDYANAVILSATTISTSNAGNITFGSTVNGDYALTASAASGAVIFNGIVGTTPLSSLTVMGTADINTTDITTTGNQLYYNNVVLGADLLDKSTSGLGTVAFYAGISGPAYTLTIDPPALLILTGPINVASINATATQIDLNNATINTSAGEIYQGAVVLGVGPSTLTDTSGNADNINFAGIINGTENLIINPNDGGSVEFQGNIGQGPALSSLSVNGETVTGSAAPIVIDTLGNQTYVGSLELGNNLTVQTFGGGAISFGFGANHVYGPFALTAVTNYPTTGMNNTGITGTVDVNAFTMGGSGGGNISPTSKDSFVPQGVGGEQAWMDTFIEAGSTGYYCVNGFCTSSGVFSTYDIPPTEVFYVPFQNYCDASGCDNLQIVIVKDNCAFSAVEWMDKAQQVKRYALVKQEEDCVCRNNKWAKECKALKQHKA